MATSPRPVAYSERFAVRRGGNSDRTYRLRTTSRKDKSGVCALTCFMHTTRREDSTGTVERMQALLRCGWGELRTRREHRDRSTRSGGLEETPAGSPVK